MYYLNRKDVVKNAAKQVKFYSIWAMEFWETANWDEIGQKTAFNYGKRLYKGLYKSITQTLSLVRVAELIHGTR